MATASTLSPFSLPMMTSSSSGSSINTSNPPQTPQGGRRTRHNRPLHTSPLTWNPPSSPLSSSSHTQRINQNSVERRRAQFKSHHSLSTTTSTTSPRAFPSSSSPGTRGALSPTTTRGSASHAPHPRSSPSNSPFYTTSSSAQGTPRASLNSTFGLSLNSSSSGDGQALQTISPSAALLRDRFHARVLAKAVRDRKKRLSESHGRLRDAQVLHPDQSPSVGEGGGGSGRKRRMSMSSDGFDDVDMDEDEDEDGEDEDEQGYGDELFRRIITSVNRREMNDRYRRTYSRDVGSSFDESFQDPEAEVDFSQPQFTSHSSFSVPSQSYNTTSTHSETHNQPPNAPLTAQAHPLDSVDDETLLAHLVDEEEEELAAYAREAALLELADPEYEELFSEDFGFGEGAEMGVLRALEGDEDVDMS